MDNENEREEKTSKDNKINQDKLIGKINNIKKIFKTKKGKVYVGLVILVCVIFSIVISQYPMSLKKAYREYSIKSELLGNDIALDWLEEEFDGEGLFGKKETVRKTQVLIKSLEEFNKDFASLTGGTVEDFQSVQIEEVWFENEGIYSNYKDINTKIINKSQKNITYIKLNIYFKDDNGNVVGSDWTNDDAIIKPNATQTISKMISKDVENASVEIADIRFEN